MEEHEKIQLRSDEFNDILSKPPSWIVRWGITVFFLTLIAILVISYFVTYPDVVEAPIVVTTPSPPMKIIAESSGRISKLNVENESVVQKGHLLVILESSANYDDILYIEKKVNKAILKQIPFSPSRNLDLGEIQFAYSNYQRDYKDYVFKSSSVFDKKQVEQISQMQRTTEKKMKIAKDNQRKLRENLSDAYKKIQMYRLRVQEGNATLEQLEDVTSQYKQMEHRLEDYRSEIVGYETEIENYDAQKLQVQRTKVERGNDRLLRVQDSMNKLAEQITHWKRQHLILAPVNGKVTLFDIRSEQQYVNVGQDLMMIIPQQEEILGRMNVAIQGAGKVEKGDMVNIALHEYPSREFGVVKGEVSRISLIPKNEVYLVEVQLPNGLETTYNEKLDFRQEMSGVGKIITDKKRFLYRVFEQFDDLVKN